MVDSREGILMVLSKWGWKLTPAFTQKQGFTVYVEYLLSPPLIHSPVGEDVGHKWGLLPYITVEGIEC